MSSLRLRGEAGIDSRSLPFPAMATATVAATAAEAATTEIGETNPDESAAEIEVQFGMGLPIDDE